MADLSFALVYPFFIIITTECSSDQVQILGATADMSSSSGSYLKAPHPKRKKRWEQLNPIMEKNNRKYENADSTAHSFLSWQQIKFELPIIPYIQSSIAIPENELNSLTQYLSNAINSFGGLRLSSMNAIWNWEAEWFVKLL